MPQARYRCAWAPRYRRSRVALSGVEVEFTDGTSGAYDLVVGADGIRSSVRELAFGPIAPRYVGQMYWRTAVSADLVTCSTMAFDEQRFVALLPLGGGITYVALQAHVPEPFEEPLAGRTARARARFADFGGPVPAALAALGDDTSVHFGPAEEIDRDEWRAGRVVLIGDAAHACSPTLAQGGSLAIEDAVVLAELLAGEASVDPALDAFVARRPRRGPGGCATGPTSRSACSTRARPHEHLAAGIHATYARLAEPI